MALRRKIRFYYEIPAPLRLGRSDAPAASGKRRRHALPRESDAMDADFVAALAAALEGAPCRAEPLARRVLSLAEGNAMWREDVAAMLREAL
jgi:hypothetical protein